MNVRGLDHGALLIADTERSRRFYGGVLGLRELERPATFAFAGAWFAAGDRQLHLIEEVEPGRTRALNPGYSGDELARGYGSHLALEVDDLDAAMAELRGGGVEVVGGPRPRGDGVIQVFVCDPDGHVIELMSRGAEVTGSEPELRGPEREARPPEAGPAGAPG